MLLRNCYWSVHCVCVICSVSRSAKAKCTSKLIGKEMREETLHHK